eukprot:TRINITY_DN596_c0_g1_i4.p1 TRINITY_DN596_c0_g1~~TRINITY_DN596_c0_g1_i4.p1  ORF type:complete len:554 (-),score=78.65 TRINITY_DN596_c0_g1_i4:480-2141(-)
MRHENWKSFRKRLWNQCRREVNTWKDETHNFDCIKSFEEGSLLEEKNVGELNFGKGGSIKFVSEAKLEHFEDFCDNFFIQSSMTKASIRFDASFMVKLPIPRMIGTSEERWFPFRIIDIQSSSPKSLREAFTSFSSYISLFLHLLVRVTSQRRTKCCLLLKNQKGSGPSKQCTVVVDVELIRKDGSFVIHGVEYLTLDDALDVLRPWKYSEDKKSAILTEALPKLIPTYACDIEVSNEWLTKNAQTIDEAECKYLKEIIIKKGDESEGRLKHPRGRFFSTIRGDLRFLWEHGLFVKVMEVATFPSYLAGILRLKSRNWTDEKVTLGFQELMRPDVSNSFGRKLMVVASKYYGRPLTRDIFFQLGNDVKHIRLLFRLAEQSEFYHYDLRVPNLLIMGDVVGLANANGITITVIDFDSSTNLGGFGNFFAPSDLYCESLHKYQVALMILGWYAPKFVTDVYNTLPPKEVTLDSANRFRRRSKSRSRENRQREQCSNAVEVSNIDSANRFRRRSKSRSRENRQREQCSNAVEVSNIDSANRFRRRSKSRSRENRQQ